MPTAMLLLRQRHHALARATLLCLALTFNTHDALAEHEWFDGCRLNEYGSSKCIEDFAEGLAAVKTVSNTYSNGLWGFIDKTGQMSIQPRFEKVQNFSQGLAPALTSGKWGYIDKTGQWVISPQFSEASVFNKEGHAFVVVASNMHLIDRTGKLIKRTPYVDPYYAPGKYRDEATTEVPQTAEYWDLRSGQRLALPPEVTAVILPQQGLVEAAIKRGIDGFAWGVLKEDSTWAATPQALESDAEVFHHAGVFVVKRSDSFLFVNHQGVPIRPDRYRNISLIAHGFWLTEDQMSRKAVLDDKLNEIYSNPELSTNWRKAGGWFVQTHGEFLFMISPHLRFDIIRGSAVNAEHAQGLLWITRVDTKAIDTDGFGRERLAQILDPQGRPLLSKTQLAQLATYTPSILAADDKGSPSNNLWVIATFSPDNHEAAPLLLTRDGRLLTDQTWSGIRLLGAQAQTVVIRDKSDNHYFIGRDGQRVHPQNFESIGNFSKGVARAHTMPTDGGTGLAVIIDDAGKVYAVPQIRVKFCDEEIYLGQLLCAETVGESVPRYHLWNPRTGQASEHDYEEIAATGYATGFDVLLTRQNGLWGAMDVNGRWLIRPSLESSSDIAVLGPNLARVAIPAPKTDDDDRRYGVRYKLIHLPSGRELGGVLTEVEGLPDGEHIKAITEQGEIFVFNAQGDIKLRVDKPVKSLLTLGPWAIVQPKSLVGLLDGRGDWVLPPEFVEISQSSGPDAWVSVTKVNGESLLMDLKGREVLPQLRGATVTVGHQVVGVNNKKSSQTIVLNREGKELTHLPYEYALEAQSSSHWSPDLLDVYKTGDEPSRFGLIDAAGKKVMAPIFDQLRHLFNDRAVAVQVSRFGKKYGYVNRQGQFAIPGQFDEAGPFSDERALVQKGHKVQFIDTSGKVTASFSKRCGQIVIQDAAGKQSWPRKPLSCTTAKPPRKGKP